jgi:DNA-binding NarL/FixJ family response regulator
MNLSDDASRSVQKILIVDDHVIFREGLMELFRKAPDFTVVGDAGSVKECIEKSLNYRPDIILMDFSLPDGTGLDATRAILSELPDCKIIFLTIYETDENLLEAVRLGAQGYMLKNVSGSSLLASLRGLAQGEMAMSRKFLSRVVESSRAAPSLAHKADLIDQLSARETEILTELQNGTSNKEIALRLSISENTVKHHIHSILEKFGVENRRQAGVIAKQIGLSRRPKPVPAK